MNTNPKRLEDFKEGYLYKTEPVVDNSYSVGTTMGTYHCKNWTFIVKRDQDGNVWMLDTYFKSWDSHKILVTDLNKDLFVEIFKFDDVRRLDDSFVDEYEKEDLFCVATDSGGYSCGGLYWVKKDAKPSKRLQIEKAERAIEEAECDLKYAKRHLELLLQKNEVTP